MTNSLPVPVDVRLMNVTTSLLVTGLVLACLAAGLWWALRNPAFAIRQIVVAGDTTQCAGRLPGRAVGAQGGGAARVSGAAERDPAGAPGRGALGRGR